jgi:hypothetical protein
VLDHLDRGLEKLLTGALTLDQQVLGRITDALTFTVLPAFDRAYQRLRRLFSSHRGGHGG